MVKALNAKGEVAQEKVFTVMAPGGGASGLPTQSGDAFQQEMLQRMWQKLDAAEAQARNQPPPKSLGEQLAEIEQVKRTLGGGDNTPLLMMMMQQNQQRPGLEGLASLRSELAELRRTASQPAPLPLPPPPPTDGVTARDLIAIMDRADKRPSLVEEAIKFMPMVLPTLERIMGGGRERNAEIERLREENHRQQLEFLRSEIRDLKDSPQRGISEFLEEHKTFTDHVKSLPGPHGSGNAVIDVISKFLDNTGNLSTLTQQVRAADREKAQLEAGHVPPPSQPQQPPPLPPRFAQVVGSIDESTDDSQYIERVIESLKILAKDEHYKSVTFRMMTAAYKGDKATLQNLMEQYLEDLVARDMLSNEGAAMAIAALNEHADIVIAQVTEKRTPTE